MVLQTSGESLNFNPHIHGILSSGVFDGVIFHTTSFTIFCSLKNVFPWFTPGVTPIFYLLVHRRRRKLLSEAVWAD